MKNLDKRICLVAAICAVLAVGIVFGACRGGDNGNGNGDYTIKVDVQTLDNPSDHVWRFLATPEPDSSDANYDYELIRNGSFFILESKGSAGISFSPLRIVLQGPQSGWRQLVWSFNPINMDRTAEESVYFVIDWSKLELEHDNHVQFYLDDGESILGFKGGASGELTLHITGKDMWLSANRPDDAVEISTSHFTDSKSDEFEVTGALDREVGFVTKELVLTTIGSIHAYVGGDRAE